MQIEPLAALIMIVGYGIIFASVEFLSRRSELDGEMARKISHVASGLFGLLLPAIFKGWLTVALLGVLFALFLLVSQRRGLVRSIHGVERRTAGEVFFPIGMASLFTLCSLTQSFGFYAPALLALTLGDTAAWFVGSRFGGHRFSSFGDTKSLEGSLAMGVVTILAVLVTMLLEGYQGGMPVVLPGASAAGIGALVAEGISPRGFDNISIPIVVWVVLFTYYYPLSV